MDPAATKENANEKANQLNNNKKKKKKKKKSKSCCCERDTDGCKEHWFKLRDKNENDPRLGFYRLPDGGKEGTKTYEVLQRRRFLWLKNIGTKEGDLKAAKGSRVSGLHFDISAFKTNAKGKTSLSMTMPVDSNTDPLLVIKEKGKGEKKAWTTPVITKQQRLHDFTIHTPKRGHALEKRKQRAAVVVSKFAEDLKRTTPVMDCSSIHVTPASAHITGKKRKFVGPSVLSAIAALSDTPPRTKKMKPSIRTVAQERIKLLEKALAAKDATIASLRVSIDDFKAKNKQLQQTVDTTTSELEALMREHKSLRVRMSKKLEEKEDEIARLQLRLLDDGISRDQLMSNEFHKNNPSVCNMLFGYHKGFIYLKMFLEAWFPDPGGKYLTCSLDAPGSTMKLRNQLITMYQMKTGQPFAWTGLIWGLSGSTVGRICSTWIPLFGKVGNLLCNIPNVTKKFVEDTLPTAFKEDGFDDVYLVGDAKDIITETNRDHSATGKSQYSAKMKMNAVRGASFATPASLYTIVTPLFAAKIEEPDLVRLFADKFRQVPAGMRILYDKGAVKVRAYLPNMNEIATPAFQKSREKFNPGEVALNRSLSSRRYLIEVLYSRIPRWRMLKDTMSMNFVRHATNVWFWAHGFSQFLNPVSKLDIHKDY